MTMAGRVDARPVHARTLLFVSGSAKIGGTELQTFEMTRWLRSRGFDVIALFDCDPGPVLDLYRQERLPHLHRQDRLWPSRGLRAWIRQVGPRAAFLYGLKVNVKWRVWLKLFFPAVRRWGTNRGLTNTRSVGWHRILLDRLTLPLLEGYITNSQFVAAYLTARGFPPSKIIYLKSFVRSREVAVDGAPLTIPRRLGRGPDLVLPSQAPVITYVANVRPVKGHELLIPALRILKQNGLQFFCLLVGELPDDGSLLSRISDAGLEQEVVFAGLRRDVDKILTLSDVFVFPSLMESCPNAVLEAMRARLPIVASPWGDQAWLVGDGEGGFVVDSRDARRFADRIEFLIRHPEERRRFGERNYRKLAETFPPAEIEAATLALFTRMTD